MGPDVDTPLTVVLRSRQQSLHRLSKRLYDDRGSGRVLGRSRDVQLRFHFWPYCRFATWTFEVVAHRSDDTDSSPALPKLNELTLQGGTKGAALVWMGKEHWSFQNDHSTYGGNGLKKLAVSYGSHGCSTKSDDLEDDFRCLTRPASPFAGLTNCTLMGGPMWPDAWIKADTLGDQKLSLPYLEELCLMRCIFPNNVVTWLLTKRVRLTLQDVQVSMIDLRRFCKGSSLRSVCASGYLVIKGYAWYNKSKHIRVLRSEDDLVASISTDKWGDTWDEGPWIHRNVLEKFMVSGGRTNEVFGLYKPVPHDPDDFVPWKDDDDDTSDLEEESSGSELKRYQALLS